MLETLETERAPSLGCGEPVLAPQLSERWALKIEQVAAVGLFVGLFVLWNYVPLRPTDLWGHVVYGRWIAQHQALPTEDLLMPLAQGMRVVDSAWLSQLVLAGVEAVGGAAGLSCLFAATSLAGCLLLARALFLQTGRLWLALAGMASALAVGFSRTMTIRPEIFAWLAFSALVWLLTAARATGALGPAEGEAGGETTSQRLGRTADRVGGRIQAWWPWGGVFVLFALWANVHGSFLCGIALVGCLAAGRGIDVLWRARRPGALAADATFRRLVYLTELAAAATLVNPYGIDLWLETLAFAANPNLVGVVEWLPMSFLGIGGCEFTASLIVLLCVFRHSRRRVSPTDVLLLSVFGLAAAARVRMIGWYAPVFAWVLVPHVGEIVDRLFSRAAARRAAALAGFDPGQASEPALPRGRSFLYTLVALLFVWIGFSFSDLSRPVLGGKPRTDRQIFGSGTPLGLTEYLRQQPPQGQVFNPQWWGDWLAWKGPPGLRPFMTTNIHLAPRHVWLDYERILAAQPGWQQALERYRVQTLLVDKEKQPVLTAVLRREPGWQRAYEDEQALVFVRQAPASQNPAAPVAAGPTSVGGGAAP